MTPEVIYLDAACGNGCKIAGYYYLSDKEDIKGVVQICHGMAEYIGRYDEMIAELNKAGYHVVGIDMMGHGKSYEANKELGMPKGHFGDSAASARQILTDTMAMHKKAKERFGDTRYILYGHSMGSFVARAIYSAPEYSADFERFVFASTMGANYAAGIGIALTSFVSTIGFGRFSGEWIDLLAFGTYNSKIHHPKTIFDWISTDEEEVARYAADPMLGFTFTNRGFNALFRLVKFIQSDEAYAVLSKKPCLLTYGTCDPVGSYGKGVNKVYSIMKAKRADVRIINYGPYRHEIQREPVRYKYFSDLISFFDEGST
ncbi:MAG: lysophospholipase [Saccharofermentans sp.]|nr:lysophospholipase [Saccharofermentans sp.]